LKIGPLSCSVSLTVFAVVLLVMAYFLLFSMYYTYDFQMRQKQLESDLYDFHNK